MTKIIDNNSDRLQINLERLGLNEKEIRVYIYLIARPIEVGSTKIVDATRLHGQFVYNALYALEAKGLVKHVVKNGRKKWMANPPSRITALVEEKRMVAHETKDMLERLFARKEEQDFEVYQGERQFVTHELEQIEQEVTGSWRDIIGGRGDMYAQTMQDAIDLYREQNKKKNIHTRFIGTSEQLTYLKKTKQSIKFFDYRILPGMGACPLTVVIRPASIVFQIYGDPVCIFKLKSSEVAQNYRTFFDALWNVCSKV